MSDETYIIQCCIVPSSLYLRSPVLLSVSALFAHLQSSAVGEATPSVPLCSGVRVFASMLVRMKVPAPLDHCQVTVELDSDLVQVDRHVCHHHNARAIRFQPLPLVPHMSIDAHLPTWPFVIAVTTVNSGALPFRLLPGNDTQVERALWQEKCHTPSQFALLLV
jgi:hypothetical protein